MRLMVSAERNITVDIAKCLGIALVVIGHISGTNDSETIKFIRRFVYEFHVPLFFFLSGLYFKLEDSWPSFLVKKIKRLYLPFLISNLVFFTVHICLQRAAGISIIPVDTFKHCIKIAIGQGLSPMGGATWFLMTLFESMIVLKLVHTLCSHSGHSTFIITIAVIVLGLVGLCMPGYLNMDRIFVATLFLWSGKLYAESGFKIEKLPDRTLGLLILVCTAFLLLLMKFNNPDMAMHTYGNPVLFLLSSFIGVIGVLSCSRIASGSGISTRMSEYGRKTIWVLIGHFAAFKIVTLIQMWMNSLPFETIFTHPCNNIGGLWPILYFAAGFFVPLLIADSWGCYRSRS